MRILFTNNPPVIRAGLARGMARLGHEVEVLPVWQTPYEEQADMIPRAVEAFRPDAIVTEGDPPNFNKPVIYDLCRRRGIPHVYWAIQDPLWHKQVSLYCASHADLVFTTAAELVPVYRQMGKPSELLLFACNPEYHHRTPGRCTARHEVVFVGNNYPERAKATGQIVGPVLAAGYDLMVWGLWWRDKDKPFHVPAGNCGGYLAYEEMADVYSSAAIILGLHLDATSSTQTSIRTFEVLGCGGFYLTQYTPAHANLFENGQHLVWSTSPEETLDLVAFYLRHPEERERIASAGLAEVYAHHTVTHRAIQVTEALRRELGVHGR